MPGAKFFPEGKLNYAENLLRVRDATPAIAFWGEDRIKRYLAAPALRPRLAHGTGARRMPASRRATVAGYLPNVPEATAALLATASLGAVWSSCSPDFGVQGVLDRFGQIEPKILFCADGYSTTARNSTRRRSEPGARQASERRGVRRDRLPRRTGQRRHLAFDFLEPFEPADIAFAQVEFNHPLYILLVRHHRRAEVHRPRYGARFCST